ncbi:MAG: YbaB/EbfC family nucleoid-associated protein [Deltaproteobacteria bacterium]|nr:YbaB/EbfC family nucleoid-associated protein [Deltaproteobacteria bacterium]
METKMKGMTDILKMAQKAQADIAALQDELADKTVEATVGGGMVTAVANGRQQIVGLTIQPEVAGGGDIEMLQDLVVAAVNEALRQAQAMANEEMSKIAGGLKLPGVLGNLGK